MTYKLGDKVIFGGEVCTYVGEYYKGYHMIDGFPNGHDGKSMDSEARAKKNEYTFVGDEYQWASTDYLFPVPTKKVTDLGEKEVIHCETEEEATRICKLMHDAGLTWNTGKTYVRIVNWNIIATKNGICYRPKEGGCSDLEYYKKYNYTIHSSKDFPTEIKEGDAVFIDDKGLTQKTPPYPRNEDGSSNSVPAMDDWSNTKIKNNLTKPIMNKLATFRNKMYFTDKKMQSLAELTQEGCDVVSSIQDLINEVEKTQERISDCVQLIEENVDENNIDSVKNYEKQLKQLLKSIKGDKTMEVLLASAEVVDKFNESL